ncbi:amidase [Halosegnis longus]|uniref:Amidase n=1 Tax=Halosegnis longus TaxID=2216012 RepID=A0AAJ4UW07_9EURY|nr:amidase [Halosegnis longus]RNJ26573.1 amidase [Salella cibi]
MDTRSAVEIAEGVKAGDISPVALVEEMLARIEERNDRTNAYVTVIEDEAREAAASAETAAEAGEDLGPLHGVPLALKDLYAHKAGVRTTFGAKPFADHIADEDAIITERLEAAGAIVLGKTNTPEFGHKPRTDNKLVGATGTPFAPDRIAGGSSGGSAAALADGLATIATGSDVGGSLRVPASCCHVASVKPSFGLVPNGSGIDTFSSHTPTGVTGPMARTVEDLAVMLDVVAGQDDRDPFSVPTDGGYHAAVETATTDVSLAYASDLGGLFTIEDAVSEQVERALDAVENDGATVETVGVDGPSKGDLNHAFSLQATAKFATLAENVEREYGIDLAGEHADDVSSSLLATIALGEGHDAVEHNAQNVVRTAMYEAIEAAIGDHDALVCPTLAVPPFPLEEDDPTEIAGEPANGTLTDWSLPWVFNVTGHPVVSVPAGLTDDGLPVGLQLVGNRYTEKQLLATARAFERANPWLDAYPDS